VPGRGPLSGHPENPAVVRAVPRNQNGPVDGSPLREDLIDLSDYVWRRLIDRLEGLTDEEYLWEPVPGCWSIHPRPDGLWTWDFSWPEPDPPPITTIAWRLVHITVNDDRFRPWLGLGPHPHRPHRTVPPTAEAAVEVVAATRAERREDLEGKARAEAEESMKAGALEAGILGRAGLSAEREVSALLSSLGYEHVQVTTAAP